jgi:xanthine/uracil permease
VFDDRSPQLDRFGPLLVLTILAVTTLSLVDLAAPSDVGWRKVAATSVSLLTGLTLLLALRASGLARRWRHVADGLFALVAIVSLVLLAVELGSGVDLRAFSSERPSALWVAIAVATPVAVVRRLLKHRRVTTATMFGAVAGYLLIALAFWYAFRFADRAQAEPFFAGVADAPTTSFMYFSLTSMTTVGYGDLTAATNLGRLLATSEAVTGQVYLVAFVAMLVGLRIQQREAAEPRAPESGR